MTEFKARETQLHQTQRLLQAFLDSISEPMLLIDRNRRPVYVNQAAKDRMSEKPDADRSNPCPPMLCGLVRSCEACVIPDLLVDGHYHRFERKNGGEADSIERVELIPLSRHEVGLEGTIVRLTDLTRQKQMERHLVHTEKMSSLGLLASGIIHEISNPNSFIIFNLPILRAYLEKMLPVLASHVDAVEQLDWFGMDFKGFRQEIFNLLDNMTHGAMRINQIVGNLRDVTHKRMVEHQPMRAELVDVIDKAITLCRKEVDRHVKCFDVLTPNQPTWVRAAPEALEQVLINLLINAAQAADKPDARVSLRTRVPEDPDAPVVIEISDNGCGIDEADLDRIFDPFFTTKAPGLGTGLGLSVSRDLIQQMGGRLEVKSTPGQQTIFSIVLNRMEMAQEPPAAGAAADDRISV